MLFPEKLTLCIKTDEDDFVIDIGQFIILIDLCCTYHRKVWAKNN